MTIGGLGASGYRPMRAITSAKFSPAALTSTMTWPGPGTGSGRSSTRSTEGSPWLVMTTARMTPRILVPGGHRLERRGPPLEQGERRDVGRQEARVDASEHARERVLARHRERRSRRRQDRRLRRGGRRRQHGEDQELVERAPEDVAPEHAEHVVGVVGEELGPAV